MDWALVWWQLPLWWVRFIPYKRHVLVILSTQVWCTFKQASMTLFQKICKADHILAWTGDDRYIEIKALHVKSGMGNLAEWQLLTDSIEHIHEKRLMTKKQTRPRRATSSTSCTVVTEEEPVSPATTRRGTKRSSKVKINYKQYHEEGITNTKIPRTSKTLPRAGPSEDHIAAQNVICSRKPKNTVTSSTHVPSHTGKASKERKVVTAVTSAMLTLVSSPSTDQPPTRLVPATTSQKTVTTPKANMVWKFTDFSKSFSNDGSPCTSPSSDSASLPDLVPLNPNPTAIPTKERKVVTATSTMPTLVSPPPIVRTLCTHTNSN